MASQKAPGLGYFLQIIRMVKFRNLIVLKNNVTFFSVVTDKSIKTKGSPVDRIPWLFDLHCSQKFQSQKFYHESIPS
jgi:hypothetical protein